MGFDFHYMLELLPILLKYLGTTLEMASWGLVFALILALFLANIRVFKVPVLDPLSQLYISFSAERRCLYSYFCSTTVYRKSSPCWLGLMHSALR